jgi:two-component system OmpR family response regulator
MRILVVDDDPAMLIVAVTALEQIGGYEVLQAKGGAEAVECAKQKHPDAILMDLVMPDFDGPDVLEMLRAHPQTERIPVIFHTARNEPSAIRKLLALGAKGVIGKPFDPLRLPGEVARILRS